MIGVFSAADASIIVACITALVTLYATQRNRRDIKQINNAVNHIKPGEPTLIERVRRLERNNEWEREMVKAIATQIGVPIPPDPDKEL